MDRELLATVSEMFHGYKDPTLDKARKIYLEDLESPKDWALRENDNSAKKFTLFTAGGGQLDLGFQSFPNRIII